MIIDDMMLRTHAAPPQKLNAAGMAAIGEESRRIKSAKEFESLIIGKMVDSMKETVDKSGLLDEEDGGSEQMQGMFWMHLASDIADKGGLGLWRDIYRSVYGSEPKTTGSGRLDTSI